MLPSDKSVLLLAAAITLLTACNKSNPSDEPTASAQSSESNTNSPAAKTTSNPAIAKANEALKTGAYDEAAARLLEARAASQNFTPAEADSYRMSYQEAYSKAVEAAAKGDPKAQAALEMIRAAR